MKIIQEGDKRVVQIIGKKIGPEKLYRLSGYSCFFSEDPVHLVHNTFTGMTVSLSCREQLLAEIAGKQPVSGSQIIAEGLSDLVSNGFLVENDSDDYEQYSSVVTLLKLISKRKGTKVYTILPTTGCNARCVYCYEEGLPVCTMDAETADRTVDFIERTRRQKTIRINWFGGEPLAGSSIISSICRKLNDKEIPFRSKIITNATLLTPAMLEEAISIWHLDSAQVSVDGSRRDYEERKQYFDPSAHHYDTMMDAVGLMLDRGIKVTLRCNYDRENLSGLRAFFDDVSARFGGDKNLSVYTAMLFQSAARDDCAELRRDAQAMNTYLAELGFISRENIEKPHKLRVNRCMADSGDRCVVIAPDGKLYHCEHLPGNTSYGSIYDPQVSVRSDDRASLPVHETCRTCRFLPSCTPFFRNGCPDYFARCREIMEIEADEKLRGIARRYRDALSQ